MDVDLSRRSARRPRQRRWFRYARAIAGALTALLLVIGALYLLPGVQQVRPLPVSTPVTSVPGTVAPSTGLRM
ncbi:hypothetical protein [Nocardia sp. NPDC052566]|uniref:hypothetical protein n=1 Tax=Nocardia sp. NPDC052566 TaxID=3364330 RepID=UPI0037CA5A0D